MLSILNKGKESSLKIQINQDCLEPFAYFETESCQKRHHVYFDFIFTLVIKVKNISVS